MARTSVTVLVVGVLVGCVCVANASWPVAAPEEINFCQYVDKYLPKECDHNDNCSEITCSVNLDNLIVATAKFDLDVCKPPAHVALDLDIVKPDHFTWDYTLSMDQRKQVDIPGASISIDHLASAGLVADLGLGGNVEEVRVSIALDVCGKIDFVGELCGSDLTKYIPELKGKIPLQLFNSTLHLDDACGDTYAAMRVAMAAQPVDFLPQGYTRRLR